MWQKRPTEAKGRCFLPGTTHNPGVLRDARAFVALLMPTELESNVEQVAVSEPAAIAGRTGELARL